MSEAGNLRLAVSAGTTFRLSFTVLDNGDPVDLSEWSARMVVADHAGAKVVELTSDEDGGLTLGTGTIGVLIQPEQTSSLVPGGRYRYDLTLTSADDTPVISKIVDGVVLVYDTLSLAPPDTP